MTLAARRALFAALAAGCFTATNLEAVVQPGSPVAEKIYRHPGLSIPGALRPAAQLPPGLASTVEAELAALGLGAESAFYDTRAGRLATLVLSEPLIPGTGVGNALEWEGEVTADDATIRAAAWTAILAYVQRHEAVLRVDVTEIGRPRIAVHEHGSLIQIYAPRQMNGVPVRNAGLTAVVNHGNLVLIGLDHWGDGGSAGVAQIGADQAQSVVAQHAQPFLVESFTKDAHLEYIPMASGDGYDFRLAWVVRAAVQGDGGTWEGLVDAVSGELIAFEDKNQYVARKALGGVYPVSNDQVPPDGVEQPGWPMPFLTVNTPGGPITTNAAGSMGCVAGTVSTALAGRYVTMTDVCGAANETSAAGDLDLAFGPTAGATDCVVPAGHSAGDTKASRTGMYELTRMNEQARGYLPANPWLNSSLPATMNINLSCNAFWNGLSVNFYRDRNSQCRNTGEIAAIFDHEWGHGMDNNGVNPNISAPGEAIADIHGILRLDESCMGRGFVKVGTCGGYGDPCTTCTGVRDLDWAKHFSNQPHDIPWIFANCPAFGQLGPCGRETHCEGYIAAESGWDLYARDLQAPPFGLDGNTALELTTRLAYLGSQLITSWYQCSAATQTGDGCAATNGYMQFLAADDDNGSLSDGTPHMTAIRAAFNRHGIACPTPAPVNSGCSGGPSAAPVLAATPQDQGVALSWFAVPNAARYYVYRTEGPNGANFGKVKVGEVTGTTFLDTNLQNGRTYYFNVLPVGANTSCFGRMSNSVTVVPAPGPNLSIRPTVSVAISEADGDRVLDNCETATLFFTVDNTGTGALTNVRVVAVEPFTHPVSSVITPLPSTIAASLGECAAANGSVSVRAEGMSFDQTWQVRIHVTADELGGQTRSVIATATGVESDFPVVGSRTYTFDAGMDGWAVAAGTFNRVDAGGGNFYLASSSCLDSQCDIVRSPMVRLRAGSTLSLQQRYDTETPSPIPYDRANVGVFDIGAGTRTVVNPNGGDPYDLGAGAANGTCETTLQAGWAADTDADCNAGAAFQASSWTAAALNPGGIFTGRSARLSIHYGSDSAASGYGFHFDSVTLTDFQAQVPDSQLDACGSVCNLTIGPPTIPAGTAGTAYSQIFNQSGGVGPITWSLFGTLPAGITFNTATGVLSGTPMQTGSFAITITARDSAGCFGLRSYTLNINCQAITVNPATIPAGTTGSPYSQTFTQTSGIGTITWSLTGTLPAGTTFNTSTGVLSGTPTQAGSFPITVRATDANGCVGSRAYTLVINCSIVVNPASIPAGTAGSPYSQAFTQTGGTGTITWSLTGALPAGLAFDPALAQVSGTPTQTGSFPITVTATDSSGCFGSRAYTLVINCQTITVNPTTIPAGTAGSPYSQTFTQTSGIGTITWSLTGALPTGLTFSTTTGVLSGTPTQRGSFPITVRATDANGCFATRAYTLVINCQTITVNPTTIPNGTAGSPYSQTFTQTSGIGTITWSLTGALPTGLTFGTTTGVLSGTPTQIGSFPITVTATDANGCAGSRGYTLGIVAGGPFVPMALDVDAAANRVFEPGETVVVAPSWRNDTGAPQAVTGAATNFIGPGTPIYTISDATANYGTVAAGATTTCSTGGDCYAFAVSVANPRPALHWDSTFVETLSTSHTKTWTLHVGASFTDVPISNPFYRFVETILHKSVTGGCTTTTYCPSNSTTRDQMAVFVLVSKEPPGYTPVACGATPMFADVPVTSPFCRWIEELARRGVVGGCGGGNYCPSSPATREQMAVFVLRTLDPALNPPACGTPMFADVPASSPFCRWIEELARRGVVTGCGGGNYCPTANVSREQMGVFLSVTFGLTLYGV